MMMMMMTTKMMMTMMTVMTTYSLVCQVEHLAIEEGRLPLLDCDHWIRVPKIWTRNKFVWGKWHFSDHHKLSAKRCQLKVKL